MSTQKPATLHWINTLRALAAVGVVILHVSETVVRDLSRHSCPDWIIANIFDAAVRWAVPVFVMISGALLLDPSKNETIGTFYRKRALRIIPAYLFWSLAYLTIRNLLVEPVSVEDYLIRLANGRAQAHLWYVHMIIGLYLAAPLLRWFIRRTTERSVWITALLTLTAAAIWRYLVFFHLDTEPFILTASFAPYIGYFLLGWLLSRITLRRSLLPLAISVFVACVAIIAAATVPLVGKYGLWKGAYFYTYFSPLVICASVVMFLSIRTATAESTSPASKFFDRLAPLTFGIYLIHPMVIEAFARLGFSSEHFSTALSIPLVSLSAFAVSALAIAVIIRIPILRRIVG